MFYILFVVKKVQIILKTYKQLSIMQIADSIRHICYYNAVILEKI